MYIMEKFKTLNNHRVRQILFCACSNQARAVYLMLYNSRDYFTDDLIARVHNILIDMCPLTIDLFESLPVGVQSFYNQLWLTSLNK